MKTIEELENEIKNLSQELENLKKEKENKRWRGSSNQRYYFIGDGTNCCCSTETNHRLDNQRYSIGNYFQTEKQAQKTVEKLKIYTQLKDLALRFNKGRRIDFLNPDQEKYIIYYSSSLEELGTYIELSNECIGGVYCLDPNFLDIAKQEIGEENLLKLFEEE
jgi:hypothetical protein